jgi:DNA (cytosine-5)-methyltransferase 1
VNVGSLFSGIGGIDLGLERAGMRVAWQCEWDPWCQGILRRHWPDTHCYGDIRTIGADAPRVDVLAGGFPCQPVSLAGKGLAQADERWLWPEFARLVRVLRPRYVIAENVPGLLARGLDIVLADLAALGFDAEWTVFGARDVGAPHKRERVWIVAWDSASNADRELVRDEPGRSESGRADQAIAGSHGAAQYVADADGIRQQGWTGRESGRRPEPANSRRDVADAYGDGRARLAQRDSSPSIDARPADEPQRDHAHGRDPDGRAGLDGAAAERAWAWPAEPYVGRVAHGVPARVDRLRALGNAVVPACAEHIGRLVMEMAS